MVPPRSDRISRVPPYSRTACRHYPYGAVTHYGRSFQIVPVLLHAATGLVRFRSPLLSESLLMSFPPGTEMFQFPGFASNPLCIQGSDTSDQTTDDRGRSDRACGSAPFCPLSSDYCRLEVGFPIRKSADQSLFAAPHGLSQRTTSFIACACQGIHRTPLRHLIALIINARSRREDPRLRRGSSASPRTALRIRPAPSSRRQAGPVPLRAGGTGLERPVSHENCPKAEGGQALGRLSLAPSSGRPDNSSLHDVKTADTTTAGKIRKRKPGAGRASGICQLDSGF